MILAGCSNYKAQNSEDLSRMDIFEKYEYLTNAKRWDEAISVIKEIIEMNPNIDTSWFNYAVCLENTGNFNEATNAFIKAHELNVNDYGIHYKIMRSMYLAEDYTQLLEFIDYICLTFKEEIEIIFESDEFKNIENHKQYLALKSKYYQPYL